MKGVGKNSGWSNQTFFRADEITLASDLEGLKDIYPLTEYDFRETDLTVQQAVDLIRLVARQNSIEISEAGLQESLAIISRRGASEPDRPVLRGEMALLIDRALDPFNNREVNLKGGFQVHMQPQEIMHLHPIHGCGQFPLKGDLQAL